MLAYISKWAYEGCALCECECVRGGEMAHPLHIADLQTWADVQMAGAFQGRVFYFHFDNHSVTAAHRDPG